MTKKNVVDVLVGTVGSKGVKSAAKKIPGLSLMEGLGRIHEAHSDYQKLREQEKTKRVAILADRDATIEQIRAQRDVIQQALSEAFELRKTGLQAQIHAMDKALDSGNVEALHIVMDGMVKTIQSSPFKDIADMREKLSDENFVLRLK